MAFQWNDRHRDEYITTGLTVLPGVIPPSLLEDLRRETDKAREIARRQHGPQTQRLQPVYAYEELNPQPFRDFLQLPALQDTVRNILGGGHQGSENMGVLLEPAGEAWCTNWHRDWGHHVTGLDMDTFFEAAKNLRLFNQLNAALYHDSSLWVVLGSHNREDTPEERALFPTVPPPGPSLESLSATEREVECRRYVRQMPRAVEVTLGAGDVAFYRASGWHLGNYLPYAKRATLHDGFYCDDDLKWQETMRALRVSRSEEQG